MNEWMNEFRMNSEWMNIKWMNRWMYWMNVLDGWINRRISEWRDVLNECSKGINEWINVLNEWMDEWMNDWMNGWMDEWMNGWMNEWTKTGGIIDITKWINKINNTMKLNEHWTSNKNK